MLDIKAFKCLTCLVKRFIFKFHTYIIEKRVLNKYEVYLGQRLYLTLYCMTMKIQSLKLRHSCLNLQNSQNGLTIHLLSS